ncbi:MAG: Lipopolysaccharide core heptosyltransferase RfaQ [Deltaproteobacteria bacterium ADurb.Bin510]|nr:MAG: Lipopolysaccharide core heptosyltransferase RfaQ [Deltaproteobacteria bacterium ADurb.Bin510]
MRILLIKLGALGDVVNTLPLAVNLKEQLGAEIWWLVEPLSLPLVAQHPAVDRAVVFDKRDWRASLREVRRILNTTEFDLALDLQRIWKSGLLTLLAPAERRIGFDRARCKELTWLLPFERIAPGDPASHMLWQYADFAKHLGIADYEIAWRIGLNGQRPAGLPQNYVVLNIGATKPANRWTAAGFAGLTDQIKQTTGLECVLTGGPEDRELGAAIAAMNPAVIDLSGRTTLDELKETLAAAAAVVSCDTGPMHLAVALARPVVALFGPADERRTGPFQGRVVRAETACAPCGQRRCAEPRCMQAITPTMVMAALHALLRLD